MENSRSINDIVTTILESPELKSSLENAVRNLNQNMSPIPTLQRLPSPRDAPSASSSVRQELCRLFPSINKTKTSQRLSRHLKKNGDYFFKKDVIVLKSPNDKGTLKGIKKARAYETGMALSNVKFNINWSHGDILRHIENLFNTFLEGKPFEIVLPIAGRLVKPNLPPNEQLDGCNLKTTFHQKIIYVRPTTQCVTTDSLLTSTPEKLYQITEEQEEHLNINNNVQNLDPVASTSKCEDYLNDLQFEHDTAQAIKESLQEHTEESNSLEDIIKNLTNKINEERVTQFNIYRADIFACCIRALRRKNFSPFNKISVKFSDIEGVSEGAIDVGGPTREMFRLVLNFIKESHLFFGEESKYISLNREALENREYFEAGRLIALSLIHGGPGPHFFSKTLYSVIIYGICDTKPTINDVEYEIKHKIIKIQEEENLTELQEYLMEESIFQIAGCQFIRDLSEKEKIFENVLRFYVLHRSRPALEQFIDGLNTGKLLELMKLHPNLFENIMCVDNLTLTANVIENLFTIIYSETGSNKRSIENRIVTFWRDLLLDCEGINMMFSTICRDDLVMLSDF